MKKSIIAVIIASSFAAFGANAATTAAKTVGEVQAYYDAFKAGQESQARTMGKIRRVMAEATPHTQWEIATIQDVETWLNNVNKARANDNNQTGAATATAAAQAAAKAKADADHTHMAGSDEQANAHANSDVNKQNTVEKAISMTRADAEKHADKAAANAVATAEGYTDQKASEAVSIANSHADRAAAAAGSAAVKSANDYTDHKVKGLQKQIDRNKKAIRRLGATAEAAANLHYNGNHNGYALAIGQYSDETAFGAGAQFGINEHNAITVQATADSYNVGGSIGFHGDF